MGFPFSVIHPPPHPPRYGSLLSGSYHVREGNMVGRVGGGGGGQDGLSFFLSYTHPQVACCAGSYHVRACNYGTCSYCSGKKNNFLEKKK